MPLVPPASRAAHCCTALPISGLAKLGRLAARSHHITQCCCDQFPLHAHTHTYTHMHGRGMSRQLWHWCCLFHARAGPPLWVVSPPSVSAATLPDMEVTCDCKTVGVREKSVFSNNQSSSVPKKHAHARTHTKSTFRGSIKKPEETWELVCCRVLCTFHTKKKKTEGFALYQH